MNCPNCGKAIDGAPAWCPQCGHELAPAGTGPPTARRRSEGWFSGLLAGIGAGIVYAFASGFLNVVAVAGESSIRPGQFNFAGCGVNVAVAAVQLGCTAVAICLLTPAGRRRLLGAERGERLAEFFTFFVIGISCPFLPCGVVVSLIPLAGNCRL